MSDILVHLFSGTVAGMSSVVFDYPLDTLKTKMQAGVFSGPTWVRNTTVSAPHPLHSKAFLFHSFSTAFTNAACARASSSAGSHSYMDCIRHSYQTGGVRSFYRGASIPLLVQGSENAVLFTVYRTVLDRLQSLPFRSPSSRPAAPWRSPEMLIASACAGAAVSLVLTPVEYVKCNLQVQRNAGGASQASIRRLVRRTWRERGIRGFLVGHKGTLLRAVPGNMAYFVLFEQMKVSLNIPSARTGGQEYRWKSMLAGGISGCAYWTICFPADVIKTRMQVEPSWAALSFRQAAQHHYKEAGWRGMYRGWRVTAVRSFLTSAVVFTVFEQCSEYYTKQEQKAFDPV